MNSYKDCALVCKTEDGGTAVSDSETVQRWMQSYEVEGTLGLHEKEDGEWVRYEDYAVVHAKISELAQQLQARINADAFDAPHDEALRVVTSDSKYLGKSLKGSAAAKIAEQAQEIERALTSCSMLTQQRNIAVIERDQARAELDIVRQQSALQIACPRCSADIGCACDAFVCGVQRLVCTERLALVGDLRIALAGAEQAMLSVMNDRTALRSECDAALTEIERLRDDIRCNHIPYGEAVYAVADERDLLLAAETRRRKIAEYAVSAYEEGDDECVTLALEDSERHLIQLGEIAPTGDQK